MARAVQRTDGGYSAQACLRSREARPMATIAEDIGADTALGLDGATGDSRATWWPAGPLRSMTDQELGAHNSVSAVQAATAWNVAAETPAMKRSGEATRLLAGWCGSRRYVVGVICRIGTAPTSDDAISRVGGGK